MKKIAVGLGFGVGLTEDGDMYMWYIGPEVQQEKEKLVLYREYDQGRCSFCSVIGNKLKRKGGADLYYCSLCSSYDTYTLTHLPPADYKVKVFVRYSGAFMCSKCGKPCTALKVDNYDLNYCEPCDLLQEAETPIHALPHKMLSGILDVNCGLQFLCVLSEKLQFKILKWAFHRIEDALIILPDNQTVSTFSCGRALIAAVSSSGTPFCYGDGCGENIMDLQATFFKPIRMRKMELPSSVKKICCGNTTVVCLLMDDSIWIYHKIFQRVIHSFYPGPVEGRKFYSDIVGSVKMVDRFFIKDNTSGVYDLRIHGFGIVKLTNHEEDISKLFLKLPASETHESASKENSVAQPREQLNQSNELLNQQTQLNKQCSEKYVQPVLQTRSEKLQLCITGLFDQKIFSDVTLKLADEEFPAHRMLLFSTSNYFRQLFTNNDPPLEVLDMSSYNPKAYRALLQHFYGAEVDVLDFEDLMDLYSLAVSYAESDIVKIITNQLKDHIRFDTVLQLLTKAKSSGNQDLVQECEQFISSSAYKDWLVTTVLQDPSVLVLKHCQKV